MDQSLNPYIGDREKYARALDAMLPPIQIDFLLRLGHELTILGRVIKHPAGQDSVDLKFMKELNEIHHQIHTQIIDLNNFRGLNGECLISFLTPELEMPEMERAFIDVFDRTLNERNTSRTK